MLNISIEKTTQPKNKPPVDELGFGKYFTDHMFVMDYHVDKGWYDPKIIPYQPLVLEPSTMVLHYGQEMFEGMKAYKSNDQKVYLFRPEMNAKRTNITNQRICIPEIPVDDYVQAVQAIVNVDREWIPEGAETSLYIRPFIIATDPFLGVRPSQTYKFIIILSPVGAYYKEGINPVKIWVETEFVRAVKGGIGYAKTGGNYAASLIAQRKAQQQGYTQVLWLDGIERKYIEEVGTMNIFFVIDGKIITPKLDGSILPGITRDSTITLLKDWGYEVIEQKLSIDTLYQLFEDGKVEEAFGTGTAAVISPIGEFNWDGRKIQINEGLFGPISKRVYETITGIQSRKIPDPYEWTLEV